MCTVHVPRCGAAPPLACLFLSGKNHLCHVTTVFSCFALGCQDLYLGELESDWNSDWNPEQALPGGGKENVCIVTSEMSLQKT